jgi:uncharacterized membrane-anchored protein
MRSNRLILAAVALSLAQIGFLGWIIAGRAAILRDGTEVLLRIRPVDPRDLLRGDYVALGYDIGSVPAELVVNRPEGGTTTQDGPIYVRLAPGPDGHWQAVSASLGAPAPALPAGQVDIRGQITSGWNLADGAELNPDYGIGRFYLPEGEGLAIQNDLRERPFSMKVAVAEDGTAQIKALLDGETVLFEEPLY